MKDAATPPIELRAPTGVDGRRSSNSPPIAPSFRRVMGLCLASFGVMVPWPLVAIVGTYSYFENWNQAGLLFGGITGIPIAILTLVDLPAACLPSLLVQLWVAAAMVPDIWLARRLSSRRAVFSLLGVQTAFSFAQAATGAMMIPGKAA